MNDLDSLFEEHGRIPDDTPEELARLKARRDAMVKREIERGIRDADGHLIVPPDVEDAENEGDEPEGEG